MAKINHDSICFDVNSIDIDNVVSLDTTTSYISLISDIYDVVVL